MKIVINTRYGGFGLSKKAYEFLGLTWDNYGFLYNDIKYRTDPKLIECVETLKEEANGEFARLKVVEIPDGVNWTISEHDGVELIREKHRTWGGETTEETTAQETIELDENFESLIFWAVNGLIGERSHAASDILKYLTPKLKLISNECLGKLNGLVVNALYEDRKGYYSIGRPCDREAWEDFRECISSEADCRIG